MQSEHDTDSIEYWNECLEQVAKTRDKMAYMVFYDHFAPRLNSWLIQLTQNTSVAEELLQETMLTVWRKATLYNSSKAAASTWLFRIARNRYIDHIRRNRVRSTTSVIPDEPITLFDDHTDHSRIHNAIKQLPVQQAQVIYKSYFEGKSHQSIASDMDIPLGTVKSNLRQAFQKLCNKLRQAP